MRSSKNSTNIKTSNFRPQEVYDLLSQYIVGQKDAIKAISIAFVNSKRRAAIQDKSLRDEIVPKNVLMMGPTGVGKTEIARRLAKETNSPFMKVEMTKFTEVGYAGRDVDTIIKDFIETTFQKHKETTRESLYDKSLEVAQEKIAKFLSEKKTQVQASQQSDNKSPSEDKAPSQQIDSSQEQEKSTKKNKKKQNNNEEVFQSLLRKIKNKELDEDTIEIPIAHQPNINIIDFSSFAQVEIIPLTITTQSKDNKANLSKMKIKDAIQFFIEEDINSRLQDEDIVKNVIKDVEERGIIFLDEIDKLISNKENSTRGEVSREGVQRDLLSIIEGTTVTTKYGSIKTDHILFIAAGAFHETKPTDLMSELQGRLPVRVLLKDLTTQDFYDILTKTKNNLLEQNKALLAVDSIEIDFTKDAVEAIAEYAFKINKETENTGARRLHSLLEIILDEISFNAIAKQTIDRQYIKNKLEPILSKKINLTKYTI
jgi:ATP-dependent HslUV protease ATP-binding subunit HslU